MYAVWSRQDAGAQWRSKAGGRENAGTVVPRVSPAGRQGQAMEDVRIRYGTGPREGAGVVQGMAEEELGRTEQGGGQGERKGKPRAVLGRRVEPYRSDVEGFIEIYKRIDHNVANNYIINMVRKNKQGKNNSSNKNQDGVVGNNGAVYEYVGMQEDKNYQNSVNVWVKRKIYENYVKSKNTSGDQQAKDPEEYTGRVLDVNAWSIEKNRRWIRTGSAEERMADDGGRVHLPGTERDGQFRLVGLEKGASDVFQNGSEAFFYPKRNNTSRGNEQKQRRIVFHDLKKGQFTEDTQKKVYRAAFQQEDGEILQDNNFIAYVINCMENQSLLCSKTAPAGLKIAFPTVLAQEMEQLDEANYRFATILEGKEVKKVIAMPEKVAESIQKEGAQTVPQSTPSESPESGAMQARSWRRSRTRPVSADPTDP